MRHVWKSAIFHCEFYFSWAFFQHSSMTPISIIAAVKYDTAVLCDRWLCTLSQQIYGSPFFFLLYLNSNKFPKPRNPLILPPLSYKVVDTVYALWVPAWSHREMSIVNASAAKIQRLTLNRESVHTTAADGSAEDETVWCDKRNLDDFSLSRCSFPIFSAGKMPQDITRYFSFFRPLLCLFFFY